MARSLSLAAYMALARRSPKSTKSYDEPRPGGELVWAQAATPAKALALYHLGERLIAMRPDLHFLITTTFDFPLIEAPNAQVSWQKLPEETISEITGFLNHWQPDICVWTHGNLRPALINCAADQDIPLLLVDADVEGLDDARWRWLPDMARAVISHFSTSMTVNENAAKRLRSLGMKPDRISVMGPLQEGAAALPFRPSDRDDLSLALAGRPIWLAAFVQLDELKIVTDAHKKASRLAHRLLLIVVPAKGADANEIEIALKHDNWNVARWEDGVFPEENTQILLADHQEEMGLWHRVSSTSFMANSLTANHNGSDPNAPAALGSAILYGPNISDHLVTYSRLAKAGAARIVRDADTLAAAVSRLIAPDQAASMARAAWEITTQGAETTDMVIDLILESLDLQGAG